MLLQATHVRFAYAPGARAAGSRGAGAGLVIDDVSLDVARGDILGLLGPNGSGKTTLLKLLSGGLRPASGDATLDGTPVSSIPRGLLAHRLAMVPQETHLAFDYTALEIVLMGRYPRLHAFEIEGPDDLAAALDALDATGTRPLAHRAFPTLSGGEKQRVIIASALAQLDERAAGGAADHAAGALLFLDEPTASLDLKYQLQMAALVRRLNADRRITVVLSTHDLRFAASVCSRLALVREGRILAQGPPAEVLTPAAIGDLYDIARDEAMAVLQ